MSRWLPFPLMSASLVGVWLLLNQSLSPGHIALGCVLAVVGGWAMIAVEAPGGRLRRPGAVLRLATLVLVDILRSNVAVARIILGMTQPASSGFVRVPLDLQNSYGLATLAIIITSTPGTVWVEFDRSNRVLIVHVLDLVDEIGWINTIKDRYERNLLEIFE